MKLLSQSSPMWDPAYRALLLSVFWWWGFLIPVSVYFYQVCLLFLLFFPLIFIFTGWTVFHQTSERVTYKSSSKPRTRFLSGPVSLSICLYLFFSISPRSFPSSLYLTCLFLLSTISKVYIFIYIYLYVVDLLLPPLTGLLTRHSFSIPQQPQVFCSVWFPSERPRISITCTRDISNQTACLQSPLNGGNVAKRRQNRRLVQPGSVSFSSWSRFQCSLSVSFRLKLPVTAVWHHH